MTSQVSKDHQLTIPPPLAAKHHLEPGALVEWIEPGPPGQLVVRLVASRAVLAARLCGAGTRFQPERDACAELEQARAREDRERQSQL